MVVKLLKNSKKTLTFTEQHASGVSTLARVVRLQFQPNTKDFQSNDNKFAVDISRP